MPHSVFDMVRSRVVRTARLHALFRLARPPLARQDPVGKCLSMDKVLGACHGEPGEPAPLRWLTPAAIGAVATLLREVDCVMEKLPRDAVSEGDFLRDLKVRLVFLYDETLKDTIACTREYEEKKENELYSSVPMPSPQTQPASSPPAPSGVSLPVATPAVPKATADHQVSADAALLQRGLQETLDDAIEQEEEALRGIRSAAATGRLQGVRDTRGYTWSLPPIRYEAIRMQVFGTLGAFRSYITEQFSGT